MSTHGLQTGLSRSFKLTSDRVTFVILGIHYVDIFFRSNFSYTLKDNRYYVPVYSYVVDVIFYLPS